MVKAIRGKGLLLGIELEPPISATVVDENFALIVASCLLNNHRVLTSYFDLAPNVTSIRASSNCSERGDRISAIDAFDQVLGLGMTGLALSFGKNVIERVAHIN